jgi:hypothetical protein
MRNCSVSRGKASKLLSKGLFRCPKSLYPSEKLIDSGKSATGILPKTFSRRKSLPAFRN